MRVKELLIFVLFPLVLRAGDVVSYADRGLASGYADISFTPATYSGATFNKDGVRHTATWIVTNAAPDELKKLASASDVSLRVYPLTDDQDGSRLVPAYDELIGTPLGSGAYIQCYPWSDETKLGYQDKSWEIDSYLWEHPEVLPVFSAGENAAKGEAYRTAQASAKNVLVAGLPQGPSPAEAALAALAARRVLVSRGFAKPTSALLRAALAAGNADAGIVRDRIAYSNETTYVVAVRARTATTLTVAAAWIDAGNWNFILAPSASPLSNDLDLSVTTRRDNATRLWRNDDSDHTLEVVTLTMEAGETYVITLFGSRVAEPAANAALAISGEVDEVEVPTYTYSAPWYIYDTTPGGVAYARFPLVNPATNVVEISAGSSEPDWQYAQEASDYLVRHFICRMAKGDEGATVVAERRLVRAEWVSVAAHEAGEVFASPDEMPESFEGWGVFGGATYDDVSDDPQPGYPIDYEYLSFYGAYDFTYAYYDAEMTASCEAIPEWYFQRYLWNHYQYEPEIEDYDRDDPDGDGCSNLAEYRYGTAPLDGDASIPLACVAFAPGSLSYVAPDLVTTTVEVASSPQGPWTPEVTLPPAFPAVTNLVQDLDTTAPSRFYRTAFGER